MRLLTISLAISLIGIFVLLLIAAYLKPKDITGNVVSNEDLVKTSGTIVSIKSIDNFNIIVLDNQETVVCFNCNFKQGDKVSVEGRVSEYQGQKQINAETIKVIE